VHLHPANKSPRDGSACRCSGAANESHLVEAANAAAIYENMTAADVRYHDADATGVPSAAFQDINSNLPLKPSMAILFSGQIGKNSLLDGHTDLYLMQVRRVTSPLSSRPPSLTRRAANH
jgi:hypothetical protein